MWYNIPAPEFDWGPFVDVTPTPHNGCTCDSCKRGEPAPLVTDAEAAAKADPCAAGECGCDEDEDEEYEVEFVPAGPEFLAVLSTVTSVYTALASSYEMTGRGKETMDLAEQKLRATLERLYG